MKAILQNFKTGDMELAEVPPPALRPGGVHRAQCASLVSAGTEKAVIELAKMNPLQKARARPDLVRKVLNKAGQEGLIETARIVRNLVSTPLPLGYSCAGVVEAVGAGVTDLHPGQRVACAGIELRQSCRGRIRSAQSRRPDPRSGELCRRGFRHGRRDRAARRAPGDARISARPWSCSGSDSSGK